MTFGWISQAPINSIQPDHLQILHPFPSQKGQEKSTSTTTSSFHSPPPMDYTTTPYFETRHPHEGKYYLFVKSYVC